MKLLFIIAAAVGFIWVCRLYYSMIRKCYDEDPRDPDQVRADFWRTKWKVGEIGFHLPSAHPSLEAHFPKLSPRKIFVPLCGKSPDLEWFLLQGHQVVGVELSPLACEAFFQENHRPFTTRTLRDFKIFEGEGISLWCGDFFQLPATATVGINTIYDRAALIALPPAMRNRYAEQLKSILRRAESQDFLLFAIAIEFPSEVLSGPPYPLFEEECKKLFDGFDLKNISRHPDPVLSNHANFQGKTPPIEAVYMVRPQRP